MEEIDALRARCEEQSKEIMSLKESLEEHIKHGITIGNERRHLEQRHTEMDIEVAKLHRHRSELISMLADLVRPKAEVGQ